MQNETALRKRWNELREKRIANWKAEDRASKVTYDALKKLPNDGLWSAYQQARIAFYGKLDSEIMKEIIWLETVLEIPSAETDQAFNQDYDTARPKTAKK